MNDTGKVLVVIPARGGSKRLPRKNVLPLAGKPLICWTIEAALNAKLDARVMVTSDDEEILSIAEGYESLGVVAHKRPEALATDTASTADTLKDAVTAARQAGYQSNTLILLQPTSPLRSPDDIQAALKTFQEAQCAESVVTVCEVDHPSAWVGRVKADARLDGIDLAVKRSQDYHKEYRLNGAVYVLSSEVLMTNGTLFTEHLRASIMPRARSFDIDEELDFRVCESLLVSDGILRGIGRT